MEYNFNKAVTTERLIIILKSASFYGVIIGVRVENGNEIEIQTNTELSVGEKAEMNGLIDSYSDFDLSIVYDDVLDEVAKFSLTLKKFFGKKNMLRGYTPVQIRQFRNDIAEVSGCVDDLALTTALMILQTETVPTTVLTQEDINDAIQLITIKLMEL